MVRLRCHIIAGEMVLVFGKVIVCDGSHGEKQGFCNSLAHNCIQTNNKGLSHLPKKHVQSPLHVLLARTEITNDHQASLTTCMKRTVQQTKLSHHCIVRICHICILNKTNGKTI